jgi:acetyl esterase/lipase
MPRRFHRRPRREDLGITFMTSIAAASGTSVDLRPALIYATHDGVELAGDLFLPAGNGPFPVLVAVHGGGWTLGARSAFQNWGTYLAARGIALFAISYRLAKPDRPTFPQAVQDVLAAVRFVRGSAAEFKLDPARVGLFGASAGAQLAALAALAGNEAPFANGYPQDTHAAVDAGVKALVGVYGVYDLADMWHRFLLQTPRENNVERLLGASLIDNRRLYFDASPISYATTAAARPAVFLAWGAADDLVPPEAHSEAFLLALKQAGFFVRTCAVQGAPHYWLSDPIDEPGSYTGFLAPRLVRFLTERL